MCNYVETNWKYFFVVSTICTTFAPKKVFFEAKQNEEVCGTNVVPKSLPIPMDIFVTR